LPVQGEVGAPALRAQELESVIGIEGDVGRQVQEVVNVAAVARQIDDLLGIERIRDGLILGLNQSGFRRNRDGLRGSLGRKLRIHAFDFAADQVHAHDLGVVEALKRDGHLISAVLEFGRFVIALIVGGQCGCEVGSDVGNDNFGSGHHCSRGIHHCSADCSERRPLAEQVAREQQNDDQKKN